MMHIKQLFIILKIIAIKNYYHINSDVSVIFNEVNIFLKETLDQMPSMVLGDC